MNDFCGSDMFKCNLSSKKCKDWGPKVTTQQLLSYFMLQYLHFFHPGNLIVWEVTSEGPERLSHLSSLTDLAFAFLLNCTIYCPKPLVCFGSNCLYTVFFTMFLYLCNRIVNAVSCRRYKSYFVHW